jgi:hypothetical protein
MGEKWRGNNSERMKRKIVVFNAKVRLQSICSQLHHNQLEWNKPVSHCQLCDSVITGTKSGRYANC